MTRKRSTRSSRRTGGARRSRTAKPAGALRRTAAGSRPPGKKGARALRARDLMTVTPITVSETTTVGELCDLLQEKNINGAPVVDRDGRLVGVVTQEDIIYGTMGHPTDSASGGAAGGTGRRGSKKVVAMLRKRGLETAPSPSPRPGERPFWADDRRSSDPMEIPVSAIMTSPAIWAEEETSVGELCRVMWNLRIHRLPILKDGKVTGLVSSMDLCKAILEGLITT
ncbi:MAG TPA: CBS domain-containing protein [Candidatus Polarisedimenticolia bacterium]